MRCVEAVGFSPPEAEAHLEVATLGSFVFSTRIVRDIEPRNTDSTCCSYDRHERVEHGCRSLLAILALGACFEANGVDGGIDLWLAYDCGDEFTEIVALGEVDGSESYACRMLQAIGVHVADH